jgi:multidrug resistance efflux pump
MELAIVAPHGGVVAGLELRPGDGVSRGQALAVVVEAEEAA